MTPSLLRLREHPDAPRWNHAAAERLDGQDLAALDGLREALATRRGPRVAGPPPLPILQRIAAWQVSVPAFRRIPAHLDLEADWHRLPTMGREDVAVRPQDFVPDDADLERMIVYRTAGTTGHALLVPHDARAAAAYQPLIEQALARHGVCFAPAADAVACFLLGAQARTVTYATTLPAWQGAGFAKLNLRASEWPRPESPARYFADMAPRLLTGDPISFAELLHRELPARPVALVTTAVAMSAALRQRLTQTLGAPVIDWYSLTETGPIGYRCPLGVDYHLLPHDLHVEALDAAGLPVPAGSRGEIAVSGGRNPFLPLLRYRTGDFGHIDHAPCPCGDPMPRIVDLEGRAPVLFHAADGSIVNPVDLSRVLRDFPFVQHELEQRADGSCLLRARLLPGPAPHADDIRQALAALLGGVALELRFVEDLGDRDGKVVPFRSAYRLED
jgi:phenylacetate-CoA ligase